LTRSAIVTGCSRGIGRAVAEALLGDGWDVIGVSRTEPEDWQGFTWLRCDVGDFGALEDGLTHFGLDAVDAVVHCAGIRGPYGPFDDVEPSRWAETIQTNLMGTASVVRAALPYLRRSDDGRILLFSGGGAFSPEPGYSAYAASKGGTIALMETLAVELADTTVTVNAVAPGFVATDIHTGTPHEGRDDGGAMARVVACVRHLLSHRATGMTGRTVSAQWDAWGEISPFTLAYLGDMGTRTRHKIEGLRAQTIRRKHAM
jgi:NAD(P)-dependent dehydrogenase (short-subunit alcohol dehydrogenase family)